MTHSHTVASGSSQDWPNSRGFEPASPPHFPLRVLVNCEYSGAVRRAFRALGHDAWSCDLLPSEDDSPHHIIGDSIAAAQSGPWDAMICFPPCTDLCVSGARHFPAKIADGRQDRALQFVRDLLACDIPCIALENPIGIISSRIRKPDQIVQPWHFGDDASKSTCLWLRGLPKLNNMDRSRWMPGRIIGEDKRGMTIVRWANQTDSGQNRLAPTKDPEVRRAARAETYQGIADAMAEQWSLPA